MALNPEKILASPPIRSRYVFDERDTLLYALGVGAQELKFVRARMRIYAGTTQIQQLVIAKAMLREHGGEVC